MADYERRLGKLESASEHNEFLWEVGLRLMRYAIETRNQVQTGKLKATAWGAEEEEMYQQWKKDPSFDALEREVLANPDA